MPVSSRKLYQYKVEKVLESGRLQQHSRLTITDKHVGAIHYASNDFCLYLAITSRDFSQKVVFDCLEEMQDYFEDNYGDELEVGEPRCLQGKAKETLADIRNKYSGKAGGKNGKMKDVRVQVEEVKGAMQKNIENVLHNQDNLVDLLNKSNQMRDETVKFQKASETVKRKYYWESKKVTIAIIIVCIALIAVIVLPIVLGERKK